MRRTAQTRQDAARQVREAIFVSFREGVPQRLQELSALSGREWSGLLDWLDSSGLALYFLDRATQLHVTQQLPAGALQRLQQNALDNAKRTQGMVDESIAVQRAFQARDVRYAVMKGISLWPASVPRPELRHQFDLDFLVAEESAAAAQAVLEERGYRLFAAGGKSLEFKIHETPFVSVKDLYKDLPYRAVELHLEAGDAPRLQRAVTREVLGVPMFFLDPVDVFAGQGMHAFKDVCSAYARTAHLLEFYRHVLYQRGDDLFWERLQRLAGEDRRVCLGLGVVTDLLQHIMQDNFAPAALTRWTVDALTPEMKLWVALYGRRAAFGSHPGSKLYLLLQAAMQSAGLTANRSLGKSLVPSRLPPPVVRTTEGERLRTRAARYRIQARFVFSRARFHVVEGIRYAAESYRWRQHIEDLS